MVSVIFSDIRGFSAMAETMEPEDLADMLNYRYFSPLDNIIYEFNGTLDKHIGDNIMGVFGAPVAYEDDAVRAVMSALQMREAMKIMNERAGEGGREHFHRYRHQYRGGDGRDLRFVEKEGIYGFWSSGKSCLPLGRTGSSESNPDL